MATHFLSFRNSELSTFTDEVDRVFRHYSKYISGTQIMCYCLSTPSHFFEITIFSTNIIHLSETHNFELYVLK